GERLRPPGALQAARRSRAPRPSGKVAALAPGPGRLPKGGLAAVADVTGGRVHGQRGRAPETAGGKEEAEELGEGGGRPTQSLPPLCRGEPRARRASRRP